jgi:DNA transformation protein
MIGGFQMSADPEYVEYIYEMLEPLGNIQKDRMFSGIGYKRDGIQFAMVITDIFYFVVDDQTRQRYIDAGQECFSYNKKTGPVHVKKYYAAPAEILEDSEEILNWAREAIEASRRQYKPKK